jgi:Zn-dependent protease
MIDSINFSYLILLAPAILISLTIHEYAHARIAYLMGDPTAKEAGRLTLNPVKHMDPLGTLFLFIFQIGWARPVPINPDHFNDSRKGTLLVSLAGPASNILAALVFGILYRVLSLAGGPVVLNQIVLWIVFINIILALFNLVPIPPLDGSKIVLSVLPESVEDKVSRYLRFGPLILIFLIFFGSQFGINLFSGTIFPATKWILSLFTGFQMD